MKVCLLLLCVFCLRAQDSRPAVVFLGDSITAGYGLSPGNAFPEQLQKQLPNLRIVNAGVSGDTTGSGLDRLHKLLATKPRLVVVELGGNDGLRGIPVSVTRANLVEIVRRVKQAGASALLVGMTLPSHYGAAYIKSFENIFSEVAAMEKITMVPVRVSDAKTDMQRDGIHPTVAGQRRISAGLLGPIQTILKQGSAAIH